MSTLYSQSSMFMSLTQWNVNRSHSLRTASVFKWFFQQFPWVLQLWRFFIKWYQKEWSKKWLHETLYSLHLRRCEMLHFVTSFIYIAWHLTSNKTKVVNKLSKVRRTDCTWRLVGLWLCLSLRCLPMTKYLRPRWVGGDDGSCSLYNSNHTNHIKIHTQHINKLLLLVSKWGLCFHNFQILRDFPTCEIWLQ